MGLIFWILLFLRETSQFLRGKAPISIFARLRLQPQRRQIKSYSLHLLLHKSNLKIHHLHEAPFEASSEGQKNTKFCCGQNCLATKMKGSSLGCFRVLCAAWLTEKINKSYIDSALAWKYKLIIPSKHFPLFRKLFGGKCVFCTYFDGNHAAGGDTRSNSFLPIKALLT